MDSSITKLKQTGTIYFWKFKDNLRNYPGWNISFDQDGADFLLGLLALMDCSEWSAKKSLHISEPNHKLLVTINNRGGNASWSFVKRLDLQLKKGETDLWSITEQNYQLSLSFGSGKLVELRNTIADKAFDVGITDSIGNNILYFWAQ